MEGQDINYLARLPIDMLWEITKDFSPDDLERFRYAAKKSPILSGKIHSNDYMFRFLKRDLPNVYDQYVDNKNVADARYWNELTSLRDIYAIGVPEKIDWLLMHEEGKSTKFCLSAIESFIESYWPKVKYSDYFLSVLGKLDWTFEKYYPIFLSINNVADSRGKIGIFELIFELYKNYYIITDKVPKSMKVKDKVVSIIEIINYVNKYYSQEDLIEILDDFVISYVFGPLSVDNNENSLHPRIDQDLYKDNLYSSNFMNFLLANGVKVTPGFIHLLVTNGLTDVLDRIYLENRSTFTKYYNLLNADLQNVLDIFSSNVIDYRPTEKWLFTHGYKITLQILADIYFMGDTLQVISETNPQILADFFDTYLNNQERYMDAITTLGESEVEDIIEHIKILLPFYRKYGNNYNFIWFTHEYARIYKIPELIQLLTAYGYGVGDEPDRSKKIIPTQKSAKLKLRICTFNLGYNVQLNQVQGSEAAFVKVCQQTYPAAKGMVPNRNISQCTYNAAKYLSDEAFGLIALQEYVAKPWSKNFKVGTKPDLFLDVLKEISGNNNYEMIGYPNQTTQIIYDKSVLGEGELVSSPNTEYSKGRPVMAVWFKDPQILVINVHAPHNVIIKRDTEAVIDSIDKLNLLIPSRILVMGDFNDPGGILNSLDVLGITCIRHSQNDKNSCCYNNKFSHYGDYIFDSDTTDPDFYATDFTIGLSSDHQPVILID